MFKKLGLYYRTIKHLKPVQIRYRLWYLLRNKIRTLTGHSYPLSIPKESHRLILERGIPKPATCNLQPATRFTFLNLFHTFKDSIDWNFNEYGKLWAYNLNYFDYLHQQDISGEEGLELIREFIDGTGGNKEGLEPYPVSLRGINWIKFLNKHNVQDEHIDASLYAQYHILLDNVEYHLLGNHLMENACSLLFGAYYFKDEELYNTGAEILEEELEEQILADGAHFERSTMYHLIILERLLDCYNLISNNRSVFEVISLEKKLAGKISLMLGWADKMAIGRQEIPLLNDAAEGIAPSFEDLKDYAEKLHLSAEEIILSESGYRRYEAGPFCIICDTGKIGPDYIPGHAHSDTFSFVLFYKGDPFIIDPGVSTYGDNLRRRMERSTGFHNTVTFDDKEQTEVWGAFRVGRRAEVYDIEEKSTGDEQLLAASHDGYHKWGVTHRRKWLISKDGSKITIEDTLTGKDDATGYLNLHFHPDWRHKIHYQDGKIVLNNLEIAFEQAGSVKKQTYDCPDGYNQYIKAAKIRVSFAQKIKMDISTIV